MKEAFASQDVARLQKLAETMDQEVFLHHLHRCIDSGLWIPNPNDAEENVNSEHDQAVESAD
ncbi:unnamed protein product [Anisakis simplex]|uniref:CDC37_C domain-containing protein n=1 Tax=Anisakis simplex TaxID=6269 RepID=A0A0M3JQ90_ANISI|nr:unnamed protein product [Anisakis simplex]